MRPIKIAPGEHYHIFNRGNNKALTFVDDTDYLAFLLRLKLLLGKPVSKSTFDTEDCNLFLVRAL